jgi:ligand-binding SRPBCC domain-containing protein
MSSWPRTGQSRTSPHRVIRPRAGRRRCRRASHRRHCAQSRAHLSDATRTQALWQFVLLRLSWRTAEHRKTIADKRGGVYISHAEFLNGDSGRMKIHTFHSEIWLPRPLDACFLFFADARNLEVITPPWLKFSVAGSVPSTIHEGARIQYSLRLRGIPIHWASEITAWEPPHLFVDEQKRGPYRLWKHEHRFAARDNGTEVVDHVRYAVLGGSLINLLFVAPDVRKIFDYRRQKLLEIFQ